MSDTPRTDKEQFDATGGSPLGPSYVVKAEFARELERELNDAKKLEDLLEYAKEVGMFIQIYLDGTVDIHISNEFGVGVPLADGDTLKEALLEARRMLQES